MKCRVGANNPMYGRKHTPETIKKMRSVKLVAKNPVWRGDDVSYPALHAWVRREKPQSLYCECCGSEPPRDVANVSGEYARNLDDWQWLCRVCHMKTDKRLERRDESGKFKRV